MKLTWFPEGGYPRGTVRVVLSSPSLGGQSPPFSQGMIHGGPMFEEGTWQKGSRGRQPKPRRTGNLTGGSPIAGSTLTGPGFRASRRDIACVVTVLVVGVVC